MFLTFCASNGCDVCEVLGWSPSNP